MPVSYTHLDVYKRQIEYWEGHFNGEVMPKQIEEFQQFFYIASRCIETVSYTHLDVYKRQELD